MAFRVMKFCSMLVLLATFLVACNWEGQYVPPYATYDAPLDDYAKIEKIEILLRSIALKENLEIFEKDRKEMSIASSGKPAFFTFYYYKEKPVLTIGNVGPGVVLQIDAFDYGELPVRELDRLIAEVIESLEELGLDFRKLSPKT